jgi:hypothetical protein
VNPQTEQLGLLGKFLDDYAWQEASKFLSPASNPLTREVVMGLSAADVAEVLALGDGENEERSWLAILRMKDGRFVYLTAWCDYTGWDCQAGGTAEWCATYPELYACIPDEHRERLRGGAPT